MANASEKRSIEAIRNITRETGFPPSPEELADALGTTVSSVQSSLIHAKNTGRVRYDAAGHLIATDA